MLKVSTQQVLMRTPPAATEFISVDTSHPERIQTERYIHNKFFQFYGASISSFMPKLVCLRHKGELKACLGVRSGSEYLFLEQYLNCPIQQAHPELNIPPEQIAELGNLVSGGRQHTLALFIVLAQALYKANYRQIVFSATKTVANILRRSGHSIYPIVEADGHRLGSSLEQWGTYYQNQPIVMRMCLKEVKEIIQSSPFLLLLSRDYTNQIQYLQSQLTHQS